MHNNIKRVYKIVIIISAILLIVLGLFVLNSTTLTSLEGKRSAVIASASEINNTLQTIKTTSLILGSSSGGGYILNQAGEAKTMVQKFDYPSANVFERLFHAGKATGLDNLNKQARETNDALSGQLNSYNDNMAALIKFIEYSPTEDFAVIGQDSNNDAERIDRAITAFKDLSTNQSVTDAQKEQLLLAVTAATEFKQSANLVTFSESIEKIQKEIITILSSDIEKIKTTYSEQYDQLIYQ